LFRYWFGEVHARLHDKLSLHGHVTSKVTSIPVAASRDIQDHRFPLVFDVPFAGKATKLTIIVTPKLGHIRFHLSQR